MYKSLLTITLLLLPFALSLYDNSHYVVTLNTATSRERVMKSDIFWFLVFGHDECRECLGFQPEYESAAYRLRDDPKVKFGYVN